MALIFCPKCGDELVLTADAARCPRGGMDLSPSLWKRLQALCSLPAGVPSDPPPFQAGGTWFCPCCRNRMVEANGFVSCPSCGRDLKSFIHELVERHPHNPYYDLDLER